MTEECSNKKKSGRWTGHEKLLFEQGCQLFGWGQWDQISMMIPSRTKTQVKSHAQKLLQNRDNSELRKQVERAKNIILRLQGGDEKIPQQRQCRHKRQKVDQGSDNATTTPLSSSSTVMPATMTTTTTMTTPKLSTAETLVAKQVFQRGLRTPVVHVPDASDLTNRIIAPNANDETVRTTTCLNSQSTHAKQLVSILASLNREDQAALHVPNTVSSHRVTQQKSIPQFVSNAEPSNRPMPQYAFDDAALTKIVAHKLMTLSHQETQNPVRRITLQSMTIPNIIHTPTNQTTLLHQSVPLRNSAATPHATTLGSRRIHEAPHYFDTTSIHQPAQDARHTTPSHEVALFDPDLASSHQANMLVPKIASASSNQTTQFVSNLISSNRRMPQLDITVAPFNNTITHSVPNLMTSSDEDKNHPVRRNTMQSMTVPRIVHTSTNQKSVRQPASISPENQEATPINDANSCSSSLWSPYPYRTQALLSSPKPQPQSSVLRLLSGEQNHRQIDPMDRYYLNSTYISGFPTNYDVLCDHVNDVFYKHIGNRRLRIMAMSSLCEYIDLTSSTRSSFVNNIMKKREDVHRTRFFMLDFFESLTTCTPRCRFLSMDVSVGRWRELNGEYVMMKIQETFRECKEVIEQSTPVDGRLRF